MITQRSMKSLSEVRQGYTFSPLPSFQLATSERCLYNTMGAEVMPKLPQRTSGGSWSLFALEKATLERECGRL